MRAIKKISLWWKFEGRYYHKDFVRGIKNLWRWFPTIWKDRDWDQTFIYEILAKKLEHQAYYIGNRDFHTRAKRDAELMLLCVRLIRIQQEDLYGMEYMDYYKQDHEFVPTDETKKWYTWESTLVSDNLNEYFEKYPRQYERAVTGDLNRYKRYGEDEEKDRLAIALEISQENQERSRRLLFKLMEENIDRWWD